MTIIFLLHLLLFLFQKHAYYKMVLSIYIYVFIGYKKLIILLFDFHIYTYSIIVL